LNTLVENLKEMAEMDKQVILDREIALLKSQLTGDMMNDMEIRDKIHNLEMQAKGVKPMDSHIDCIGCGS
jgi:hypothetical protein